MAYREIDEEYIDYLDNPDQIPVKKNRKKRIWIEETAGHEIIKNHDSDFTSLEMILFFVIGILTLIIVT